MYKSIIIKYVSMYIKFNLKDYIMNFIKKIVIKAMELLKSWLQKTGTHYHGCAFNQTIIVQSSCSDNPSNSDKDKKSKS